MTLCMVKFKLNKITRFITILVIFFLYGCGSFEKYKSKTSTSKESEKETHSGTETNTTAFKNFFSYEPYDNTKPMIIGRDTIINTRIINNKETIFTHSKDTVFIKEKAAEKINEDVKHKESDNTKLFVLLGLGAFFFLFLFFLIIIVAIYIYFRKFTKPLSI